MAKVGLVRSERFELPTLGFEVRCSIQLSYERSNVFNGLRATDLRSLDPLENIRPKRSPARLDYQSWAGRATGAFSRLFAMAGLGLAGHDEL